MRVCAVQRRDDAPLRVGVGAPEPGDDRLQHHGRVVSRLLPLPLLDDAGRQCNTGSAQHERLQFGLELIEPGAQRARLPVS